MTSLRRLRIARDAEALLVHGAWLARLARALVASDREIDDVIQPSRVAVRPPAPTVASPVEAGKRARLRLRVIESVLALAEPCRSAVILRFIEDRDVGVIARLTAECEEHVRASIRRGVVRVRELLERDVVERSQDELDHGAMARSILSARLREIAAGAMGTVRPSSQR